MKNVLAGTLIATTATTLPLTANNTAQAVEPKLKGYHLAPTFNAAVINQMGATAWVGTDGILSALTDPALDAIQGEYIHRAVNGMSLSGILTVKQRTQFQHRWILTNEYDLHYSVPDAVSIITGLHTNILLAYPDNPSLPQLYLNMGSDVTNLTYHTAVWDALPALVKSRINGFTFHRYRDDLSASNFKTDARNASAWMNARGLGSLKLYCGEFGLDATYYSQDEGALFAEQVWNTMKDVSWCDGLFWYFANAGSLNYIKLVNDAQTKLTKTGRAWRDAV